MPQGDRKLNMAELERVSSGDYRPKVPIRAVLDDVRSRHNVGSIFRTADSFGISGLDLCGFTPCPPHREIEKTALGATNSVPWEHHDNVLGRLRDLKEQGYRILAVEQTVQARSMEEIEIIADQPLALIFGNELSGVSDAVIEYCDGCLLIPQFGSKHSLNVSVCAGIVLWWAAGRIG